MRHNFAVFILSHGRANNIQTLKALKNGNYTGRYYIVIDNEDDQEDEYRRLYGDKVIQFDKLAVSKTFDTMDTQQDRRAVVYARNACWEIAEQLGVEYFLELDDDYKVFMFRKRVGNVLGYSNCEDLDRLFDEMLDFLDTSGALTVALAQGGDFIGGLQGAVWQKGLLRKAMNTFFCRTDNRFDFIGRINEDVNTYTSLGNKGKLMFTVSHAMIIQEMTQQSEGGMSGLYLDNGTYLKSFYTVLCSPQCTAIGLMGSKHKRLHHRISWNNCTPQILNERYKKG